MWLSTRPARLCVWAAEEVFMVYRRTRDEMPANDEEIEEAEHEKIKLLYLLAPIRMMTANGRASGLECQRMELGDFDAGGRRRPVPVKGSEFVLRVDWVIPAIGYIPDLSCLPQGNGFTATRAGTLSVDPLTLATHLPGVFAGGDLVTGPSTVVEAMAGGYQAAVSIDRYLRGQDLRVDRVFKAEERAEVPKGEESRGRGGRKTPGGHGGPAGGSPGVHVRGSESRI